LQCNHRCRMRCGARIRITTALRHRFRKHSKIETTVRSSALKQKSIAATVGSPPTLKTVGARSSLPLVHPRSIQTQRVRHRTRVDAVI
jgi:hypothetical protein